MIADLQEESHQRDMLHKTYLVVRILHIVGDGAFDWFNDTVPVGYVQNTAL